MSFPVHYAGSKTRRPRRAASETRQQLVLVAVRQIAEVGFHKMSIADVAKEGGISQSGLLHHFPSKAALLTAVLEQREREDSEFLFGDSDEPMGWAAFDALIALAARNSTRPDWVGVYVRVAAEAADPDHPAHDWLLNHYDGSRAWLTGAIGHGIAQGEIRPDIPIPLVVGNTIAMLDGIQQQWVVDPDGTPLVAHVRVHVHTMKVSWSTTPPPPL